MMNDPTSAGIPSALGSRAMRRRRGEPPPPRHPRLNAYRLAKFAGRVFNDRSETESRELAARNWREFMQRRFRLSDVQRDALTGIEEEVAASIAGTVRELIETGGELEVTLPEGRKGGEVSFFRLSEKGRSEVPREKAKVMARRVDIPIMKCSFDANCRNWKCKPG